MLIFSHISMIYCFLKLDTNKLKLSMSSVCRWKMFDIGKTEKCLVFVIYQKMNCIDYETTEVARTEIKDCGLIGKTIEKVEQVQNGYLCDGDTGVFDDMDQLDITFTDGTLVTFKAHTGSFTGLSKEEFPCFIRICDIKNEGIVVEDKN